MTGDEDFKKFDNVNTRSEEEFEKFQQMDIERRRQEAALGADRKPRLMEESELPPFLTQVVSCLLQKTWARCYSPYKTIGQ
jgi:hypothetical protein